MNAARFCQSRLKWIAGTKFVNRLVAGNCELVVIAPPQKFNICQFVLSPRSGSLRMSHGVSQPEDPLFDAGTGISYYCGLMLRPVLYWQQILTIFGEQAEPLFKFPVVEKPGFPVKKCLDTQECYEF
jgi:hypothetical protein